MGYCCNILVIFGHSNFPVLSKVQNPPKPHRKLCPNPGTQKHEAGSTHGIILEPFNSHDEKIVMRLYYLKFESNKTPRIAILKIPYILLGVPMST